MSPHRILVAEDDPAVATALAGFLAFDYEVMLARDGQQGLDLALASPPDLIVTDVAMPKLDGLTMVRRIREALRRKIPVIVLTALDRPMDVVAGIQAGARHYIVKPIRLRELEEKVRRALA